MMAFVCERIAGNQEKWERYGMPDIEQRIGRSSYTMPSTCTIDHDRGISLIGVAEQRNADHRSMGLTGWVFDWHGHRLWVEIKTLSINGGGDTPYRIVKQRTSLGLMGERVLYLRIKRELPPDLTPSRGEILRDLYDALLVYTRDVGLRGASCELTFDIAEGV
jgi:hypothetical protein